MDIGLELAQLRKRLEAVERAARLSHASMENTAIQVYDGGGSLRAILGQQADGTTAVNVVNGPAPAQPSTPVIASVLGGVTASWDGTFADGSMVPLDWQRVEVHASTTSAFTPGPTTLRGTIESPQGGTVVIVTDNPVYVRLLARNTSGTPSTASAQAGPLGPTAVVASDVLDGIITTVKLADDAVTAAKVAVNAIDSAAIQDAAVNAQKIGTAAVTAAALASAAVTSSAIATDAVTAGKVAANAITTRELVAGSVTTAKVAAGAITANEIAASTITTGNLAANSVTATQIAANAVQAGAIAADAVAAGKIAANAVTSREINSLAVTADKIAANAITTGKIAAGAVDATAIAADAITGKTITGGTINGTTINGGSLNTTGTGSNVQIITSGGTGIVRFPSQSTVENTAANLVSTRGNPGAANEFLLLDLNGPQCKSPADKWIQLQLNSQNADASSNPNIQIMAYTPTQTNLLSVDPTIFRIRIAAQFDGDVTLASGHKVIAGSPQTPTYQTGFSGGSAASTRYAALTYRITAEGLLHIAGAFKSLVVRGSGAFTAFVLPAGYIPASLYSTAAIHVDSGDAFKAAIRLNVDNTGSVNFSTTSTIAANDGFYVNILVPMT